MTLRHAPLSAAWLTCCPQALACGRDALSLPLITADAGGGKQRPLAALESRVVAFGYLGGLTISVSHFPPACPNRTRANTASFPHYEKLARAAANLRVDRETVVHLHWHRAYHHRAHRQGRTGYAHPSGRYHGPDSNGECRDHPSRISS